MSQNANTLQQSFITWHRIRLLPGQQVERAITGVFFMVAEQEGDAGKFHAGIDDLGLFPVTLGLRFRLPGGNSFSKLRFLNPLAAEITIELYAGTVECEDMRLNIVRGRAAPVMDAETVITHHSAAIAAAGAVDLSAEEPPGPKYVRRCTHVTNMDPAVDIDLATAGDDSGIFATVMPRTSYNVPSSAPVIVQNNSAAPVTVRIAQIWYVVT
jgi:hypothetical protein